MSNNEKEVLVSLKDVEISFPKGKGKFVAVDHVSFDIYKGETFSLVGEYLVQVRRRLVVLSSVSTIPVMVRLHSKERRLMVLWIVKPIVGLLKIFK